MSYDFAPHTKKAKLILQDCCSAKHQFRVIKLVLEKNIFEFAYRQAVHFDHFLYSISNVDKVEKFLKKILKNEYNSLYFQNP